MRVILNLILICLVHLINGQSVWTKTALIDSFPVLCLAASPNDLYAGLGGGGVYRSIDEGMTWTQINNGIGPKIITSITIKGNKIYAASFSEAVYISTNRGESWTAMKTAPENKYIFSLCTSGPNLIAATWNGIYYSADDNNWIKASITGRRKHNIILSVYESKSSLLAGSGQYIFSSKDNGKNWTSSPAGSDFDMETFAERGNSIFAGSSGDGIVISSDGGTNWTKKPLNKDERELMSVSSIIVDSTNLLAGSGKKGVINEGDKMNQGYVDISIKSLIKHKGFYFAGTPNAGLWKYAIPKKLQSLESRNQFELSSALYPNPANKNSTLIYSINQQSQVTIDLVLADGRVVKHINYFDLQPGTYELKLDQKDLMHGIYYMRIKAQDVVQVKKLFIVH